MRRGRAAAVRDRACRAAAARDRPRSSSQAGHLALARLARQEDAVGQALLDDLAVELRGVEELGMVAARGNSPPSSTTISSASAIVDSRWAMISVVRPAISSREGAADLALGRRVDRRRRVVEDQDARVRDDRARDRDALALAARERQAALADARVVAGGKPLDEVVGLGAPSRLADLLLGGVGARVGDVLVDVVEKRNGSSPVIAIARRSEPSSTSRRSRHRSARAPRSGRRGGRPARRASSCPTRSRRPARPCDRRGRRGRRVQRGSAGPSP